MKEREMQLQKEKKEAFKKKMKDLDRLVAEANECSKLMHKRIYFST
jgi:hypothetical protein